MQDRQRAALRAGPLALASAISAKTALRAQPDFLSRINMILAVQIYLQK
jgi:hypothetical protein